MERKNIEDLYPLSPMQRGMMFHTLSQPESGVYLEQIRLTLEPLDAALFRQAWTHMFRRFTALRTSVLGTGRKDPVQVIRREVELPWAEHDCSEQSAEEQQAWIHSFLERSRRQGFQLSEPSLNRLALVRLDERRYEFIWTLHHIVLDGWSGAIVIRDLLKTYESLLQGHAPDLPPVPPFREYISWLRRQDASGAEAYWKRTLQGFTVPTPIGGDRRDRIGRDVSNYEEHSVRFSTELTDALRNTAAAARVTVNTLMQGAWALLLSRYANEEDVLFGTVVSGRPDSLEGVDRMVGMFVNTLPLRVRVDDRESTTRWLQALQQDQVERQRHEHSPLWEVQRLSDVPAGVPLFETLFVFENYRVVGLTDALRDGLKVDLTPPFDRTGFPLMLLVQPAQRMQLRVTCDSDRFERSTIERMIGDLERLLQRMTEHADAPLAQLMVLDDAQRRQILVEWNETAQAFPTDRCMHELVEAQADQRPAATAVEFGSEQLTYGALEERANRLAHHLQALGVGPDVPVGICVQRSLDMVVGVLGILKAGGAYVPLDPGYPPERLSYMLADAAVPVVITHDAAAAALPDLQTLPATPTVIRLDRDAATIAARPATRPPSAVTPEHLLYVLFTSGSTGRPKGVAMPHAPLVNLMHWQLSESKVGAGERTLQFAPFSFDVSCQEIFATLAAGGTLCLIDETVRRDPEALLRLLEDRSVARVFMPFIALQQLAETADRTDLVPSGLREVISAGEQLQVTPALIKLFQRLDDCTLCNQYGPTECHVVSSYTCTGPPERWPTLPPIGRPIANTRLYLLDRSGEPVPIGVPGELFIGGRAVARGYLNDQALTTQRFTSDPHGDGKSERRYRTGDLGRYLSDGTIEFLGRADHQVKLRGYRVEPGEVESVLLEHPAVREAAAVVREDRPGDRRLIGYVVADEDRRPEQDALRSFASQRLPEYMVPSAFVCLPSLPLTPSGKVDRRALLAERFAPLEQRAAYVAPRDGVEDVLASIWTDVLGVTAPGVHDNFFELGGHSLMVTQLVSRMRDALRTEVALRDVFDHPTIAELRTLVNREPDRAEPSPLTAVPRDHELPLSFAQQRLWFLDQLGSGAAYNMPWAFRLRGALNAPALEESLNRIVARHEALRTCFPAVNGKAVQRILPALPLPIRTIDLSGRSEAAREEEAQRLYAEEALKPFDLAQGPLFRVTLVRLGEDEHLLFLSIHHIVFDGWSIGVFNHELFSLYRELSAGVSAVLPALPVQYADFSRWQSEWLQGDVVDRQLRYWKQKLDGLERLDLPTDRPRPALMTYRGGAVRFDLPPELARSLRVLSQRRGVTLAMTMMAAFKVLLARWSGQPDIVVGSPIANRTRSEVENLIGFFVNSLVLRTDLSGEPSFVEVLQRVQQTALEAYEHQDLPFERLVDELQPERDQSRNPLFQVVFALQNASREPLQLPGVDIEPFQGRAVATRFDLELHLQEAPAGVGGGFCFNTDLFDQETIQRLARRFRLLLESIVAEPETPVGQLKLLPDDERRQLLEEWNDPSVAFPVTECLHERFERQVQRTPDAVAVVFEQQQLTYDQLNRRANQLAHRLRALGVGPDVLVGLSLDRNLDLVVGILGILKAGGGYVPLDLANPSERIAFILRDTRIGVLVTENSQLEKLPDHDATVVCLDADRSAIDAERDENPEPIATPDNVAYVIYTSGSTGTPKGVLVEHRTVGRLFTATEAWFRFGAEDVWTLFHSSAFDFSVWEMWGALLYGGRLVVVPYWVSRSPEDFYKLLDREQVTVLNQTPSAFRQLMRAEEALGEDRRLALRFVIFGGEALELNSLAPWFDRHGDQQPQLVNMYGITETSVHVTYRPLSRRDLEAAAGSVIGRPIPDLQVYILDAHRQPVPIGVPGEMYVGGAGVARGYLDRPELTAERFIGDPFRPEPDARLYRTGDVGRYLVNGDIEYLGRNDEQVKVRGYRIELGEIESGLNAHPWVRESVVTVRDEGDSDRRLVGYLVPDEEGARAEAETLVTQWQTLYDSTYGRRNGEDDPTFNITGWNSSYTGEPIPAEQMRNWVNETVDRIRRGKPRRVLEIGCGTGLLLFRVAPHCDSYLGTDFSQVALDHIAGHLDRIDGLASKVQLQRRLADDFEGLEPESFDTVILNSVIQYFPSIEYLLEVIEGAVACTAPGGRVYIGDVRDMRLLEAYHASVQLAQAEDELAVDELQQRVRQRLVQEEELVVDPAFFFALRKHLPRISGVRIEPKRSRDLNELTKFRYEVTLDVESEQTEPACPWLDWDADRLTVQSVRERLEQDPQQGFGIHGVPNARTIADLAAAQALLNGTNGRVGALRRDLAQRFSGAGIDPAELVAAGESQSRHVAVSGAGRREGSAFDVRFFPRDGAASGAAFPPPRLDPRPWTTYANHPLQAKMTRQLAPQLRESLERILPKYMIPSAFVMLQSLPMTANGKVDRRRLPEPEWYLNQRRGTYVAPCTPTERQLAKVWSELLGVENVGRDDNFFDLGGHSLLATQVISRAREHFGVELEVRQLFDTPTVAGLSESIDGLAWVGQGAPDPQAVIDGASREGGVL